MPFFREPQDCVSAYPTVEVLNITKKKQVVQEQVQVQAQRVTDHVSNLEEENTSLAKAVALLEARLEALEAVQKNDSVEVRQLCASLESKTSGAIRDLEKGVEERWDL